MHENIAAFLNVYYSVWPMSSLEVFFFFFNKTTKKDKVLVDNNEVHYNHTPNSSVKNNKTSHDKTSTPRKYQRKLFPLVRYPRHRHSGASACQVLEGKRLVDPSEVPGPCEGKGHGACVNGKVPC